MPLREAVSNLQHGSLREFRFDRQRRRADRQRRSQLQFQFGKMVGLHEFIESRAQDPEDKNSKPGGSVQRNDVCSRDIFPGRTERTSLGCGSAKSVGSFKASNSSAFSAEGERRRPGNRARDNGLSRAEGDHQPDMRGKGQHDQGQPPAARPAFFAGRLRPGGSGVIAAGVRPDPNQRRGSWFGGKVAGPGEGGQ